MVKYIYFGLKCLGLSFAYLGDRFVVHAENNRLGVDLKRFKAIKANDVDRFWGWRTTRL